MDFQSKAKAIWEALDDMAKKNPDAYRQFIQDQLHGDGAEEMWKQLGMGGAFPGGPSHQNTASTSEKTKDSSDAKPSSSSDHNAPKKSSAALLDQTLKQSSLLNPLLAQVMMEEDEDTESSFIELHLGSGDKNCKKGKPLIEEL